VGQGQDAVVGQVRRDVPSRVAVALLASGVLGMAGVLLYAVGRHGLGVASVVLGLGLLGLSVGGREQLPRPDHVPHGAVASGRRHRNGRWS